MEMPKGQVPNQLVWAILGGLWGLLMLSGLLSYNAFDARLVRIEERQDKMARDVTDIMFYSGFMATRSLRGEP